MKKCYAILILIINISFNNASYSQEVCINEVAYSNKSSFYSNDGQAYDWFEIYNKENYTINLKNYQVTDDTKSSSFWTFPSYELRPHSSIVVFASGKDIIDGLEFHTNFKLKLLKDTLYLINPSGEIIDQIVPTCVPANYTFGRKPDGSDHLVVMVPTPGKSNNEAQEKTINYQPDSLIVNYNSGFYDTPISLEFSNLVASNTIVYTVDGEVPDINAGQYTGPILLQNLTTQKNRYANLVESNYKPGNMIFKGNIIRAIVMSDGCPASNEISNVYFINKSLKGKYKVPVVSLITEKDNLFDDEKGIYVSGNHDNFRQHGKEWERPVHIEMFDTNGIQIIDQDGGTRIHGRGSRKYGQKSFRLYADEEYGKPYFEYPFFKQKPDITHFKTLLLRNTMGWYGDLFRDELCHSLVQDMNIDYTACQTVITFVNGEYWGIYSLRERQDIYYVENNLKTSITNMDIVGYGYDQVVVEEGSDISYNRLINQLEQSDPEDPGYLNEIGKLIDIEGVIDYFIAQIYLANTDFPKDNIELWRPNADSAKWRYFFFDLDGTMYRQSYDHLSEYNNQNKDFQRYSHESTVILRSLLKNNDFRDMFYARFNYHMNNTFNTSRVLKKISGFEKLYLPLVSENIYRWDSPSDFDNWIQGVQMLKDFAVQRPTYIFEQLQKNFGSPFTIYPNPAQNHFYIKLAGNMEVKAITIYNNSGLIIKQQNHIEACEDQIEVTSGLSPGMYFIEIKTNDALYTEKLLIK